MKKVGVGDRPVVRRSPKAMHRSDPAWAAANASPTGRSHQ